MNNQEDFLSILQLGTGLFWIITYILIIKRGFQDKKYGMPMVAICANISWEFIFLFIFPNDDRQKLITSAWFVLDIIILIQYLIFGRKEFKKYISVKLFYSSFFITLGVSFLIIIAMTLEFNDVEGKYAAFSQNLMMSGLFISLLLSRGNSSGQSIYIAVFKMLGSLLAAIAFFIYFRTYLITILSVATLFYDLIYIVLLCKLNRKRA
ncbi:hypothetical protein [Psychrobacillus sp. OK032]|uniref:transmembrane-type terpene cyclase n=1 Tax=Psychrobacillus sp. OK032 TaxID=1884358 RepID=UPI0008AB78FB|nr:hypothetical protein [Psychrobacillus sp. OK032]SES34301.1 hypothetical protein SAMN05518872_108123 [Psychrobacillus sp. OK032]